VRVGDDRGDRSERFLVPWPAWSDDGLVDPDLSRVSPRFAELWRRRIVHSRSAGRKTIVHPEVGAIELDCDVLTADGTDVRLVVYTADPSSPDADKLELVRVLGLQTLGADIRTPPRLGRN
jgi:hypothetical protein